MNTNGLFSIINITQEDVCKAFKVRENNGKSSFALVNFVEYVKNNTIITTNIPPKSLSSFNGIKSNYKDGNIMKVAYEHLSDIVNIDINESNELKAVSQLFIEQCVLATNAARRHNSNNETLYTVSNITDNLIVIPTFPVILSDKSESIRVNFLDKDIKTWHYDDDNLILNETVDYFKSLNDKNFEVEVSCIISSLINKYPHSINFVIYKEWINFILKMRNMEIDNINNTHLTFTLFGNDANTDKIKLSVSDMIYYELAFIKLASCGVYCEMSFKNIY